MSPEALLSAHRALWHRAFSPRSVLDRVSRGLGQLSPGGRMLSLAMNGFYGLKQLTGNEPATVKAPSEIRIAHPSIEAPPTRLTPLRLIRDREPRAVA